MPSSDVAVDAALPVQRCRTEFNRILSNWMADLLALRREGVLEHTWRSGRDEFDAGIPLSATLPQRETADRFRRAA